MKEDDSFILQI